MSVAQQGLALDIIRHYLEGHTQVRPQGAFILGESLLWP